MPVGRYALVEGDHVWKGPDMARRESEWIWTLPKEGVAEISAALAAVERRGLAVPDIRREDFPLPSIAAKLAGLAEEVEEGRGFTVVRGLPVGDFSYEQLRKVFWGIGLHFGHPVHQDKHGSWFMDVRDEGRALGRQQRGYHGHDLLDFHSDGANTVVLLCLAKAKEGGLSSIVSAGAVHNALLARDPTLLDHLYEGFPHDRRGDEPEGEPRVSPWKLPIFSNANGRFSCVYSRKPCEWGRERLGRPMTAEELRALDTFDATTNDPEFRLFMDLQPGDMQFVNNFTVLHSRTAFVDHDDPARRRHMLRLWLEAPHSRRAVINKLHLYTRTPLPQGIEIRPAL